MIKNKTWGKEANWTQRVDAFLNHSEISNDTYSLPIVWKWLISSFPYHQSNKQLHFIWTHNQMIGELFQCSINCMSILWTSACAVLCLVIQLCPTLQPHGLQPARLLCPWGFSRQEYRSELSWPPPGDLPSPGIKPCITDGFFTIWATREVNRKLKSKFILRFVIFKITTTI